MKVIYDADLRPLNTFAVEARCRAMVILKDRRQLPGIMRLPEYDPTCTLILGGGSNVLFTADYPGLVVANRLTGKQILDATDKHAYVRLFAGESWHECVMWSLDQKLAGIENLSLIPGSAGAAPIQNIGAYGVELESVLDCVEAWDLRTGEFCMLSKAECQFSYRDSLFKQQPGRYWVTSITLKLARNSRVRTSYHDLKEELMQAGVERPVPRDVSEAVIRIRKRKLPDPEIVGNAGSFFKNSRVTAKVASEMVAHHPELPVYEQYDGSKKLSAAWMIEHCDWKGMKEHNAGVSDQHALVLVNHGGATGAELISIAHRIQASVKEHFAIELEIEPQVIGPA